MAVHPHYPTIDEHGFITKAVRYSAWFFSFILPLLGTILALVLGYCYGVSKVDLGLFLGMNFLYTASISIGYHRLFTHRSFQTYQPIRYALATLGTMSAQGGPILWVAQHRMHHAFTDKQGDPHSPIYGREETPKGIIKALWHAHVGHFLQKQSQAIQPHRYAADLEREKYLCMLEKNLEFFYFLGLALPFLIGALATQSLFGGLTGLLWGGLVRIFVMSNAVSAVNSLGHTFGKQSFKTGDSSRNIALLALLTFGDSWHNNHHAFPTSARHGFRWWEIDISWQIILCMEKLGLVWDVVRITPELQKLKRNTYANPTTPY